MKKLAVLILLALSCTSAQALTRSQILTEARLRIKDSNTARQRYTDTQLGNLTNEAQRDANNATWVTISSTNISLVASTIYYDLPSDFIVPLRATRDYKLLSQVTMAKLDADFGGGTWESTTGTPIDYFINPALPEQIGVYPYPSASATLRLQYVAQPADLSSDSDIPFNGITSTVPYDDLLIFYVAYRIYLIEGEVDKAQLYRQEYESRLQMMHDRIGQRPDYNPGLAASHR